MLERVEGAEGQYIPRWEWSVLGTSIKWGEVWGKHLVMHSVPYPTL